VTAQLILEEAFTHLLCGAFDRARDALEAAAAQRVDLLAELRVMPVRSVTFSFVFSFVLPFRKC
jgi:hypothetical protein